MIVFAGCGTAEPKRDIAEAYYDRGVDWAEKGEYDKAIVEFNEAIRLNPKYADAYYYRGEALKRQGLYSKASKDFVRAGELGYDVPR